MCWRNPGPVRRAFQPPFAEAAEDISRKFAELATPIIDDGPIGLVPGISSVLRLAKFFGSGSPVTGRGVAV